MIRIGRLGSLGEWSCHSEQTRHGDKNWRHDHAIGGVLARHLAESLTGSSLASPSKACTAWQCLAYEQVHRVVGITTVLSFKSLQGRHRSFVDLRPFLFPLQRVSHIHLSNHGHIVHDRRCVRRTHSSRRSSLVRVCISSAAHSIREFPLTLRSMHDRKIFDVPA